jgi:hypothetical protein
MPHGVTDFEIEQAVNKAFNKRKSDRRVPSIRTKPMPSNFLERRLTGERRLPEALRAQQKVSGRKYGRVPKGFIHRSVDPNIINVRLTTGAVAAKKYLAKKATAGTLGKAIKVAKTSTRVNPVLGSAVTALELGSHVVAITQAKRQESEAKLGARMMRSGLKTAKLKKSLSKPGREGVPVKIKVN